jgi:hypothetical protein
VCTGRKVQAELVVSITRIEQCPEDGGNGLPLNSDDFLQDYRVSNVTRYSLPFSDKLLLKEVCP